MKSKQNKIDSITKKYKFEIFLVVLYLSIYIFFDVLIF